MSAKRRQHNADGPYLLGALRNSISGSLFDAGEKRRAPNANLAHLLALLPLNGIGREHQQQRLISMESASATWTTIVFRLDPNRARARWD